MATTTPPTSNQFTPLAQHQFVVLTTYRRDGTPVPTTVWFANAGAVVYITTRQESGKLKRVRRDGRVLLTPADRMGTLLGEPAMAGNAREVTDDERAHALAALATKYGAQWTQAVGAGEDDPARAYIVVE